MWRDSVSKMRTRRILTCDLMPIAAVIGLSLQIVFDCKRYDDGRRAVAEIHLRFVVL